MAEYENDAEKIKKRIYKMLEYLTVKKLKDAENTIMLLVGSPVYKDIDFSERGKNEQV